MEPGQPIAFRLSAEAIELLDWARDTLNMRRSAAVELAIRELRQRWEAKAPVSTPQKKKKKIPD